MTTLVLIAIPAIGFAAVLVLAGMCAAAGRADAHLDAIHDANTSPQSVEPGEGTLGSTHPLDAGWRAVPDWHARRERRQG